MISSREILNKSFWSFSTCLGLDISTSFRAVIVFGLVEYLMEKSVKTLDGSTF